MCLGRVDALNFTFMEVESDARDAPVLLSDAGFPDATGWPCPEPGVPGRCSETTASEQRTELDPGGAGQRSRPGECRGSQAAGCRKTGFGPPTVCVGGRRNAERLSGEADPGWRSFLLRRQ